MKMNKLRLTNVTENHFYLDFNWKDRTDEWSVSWQRKKAEPEIQELKEEPGIQERRINRMVLFSLV